MRLQVGEEGHQQGLQREVLRSSWVTAAADEVGEEELQIAEVLVASAGSR
jgi:hypothetical protein